MTRRWILCPVHNALPLTKQAVNSFLAQTVIPNVLLINNGSKDGTAPYLNWLTASNPRVEVAHIYPQLGVANGWNTGLGYLFSMSGVEEVLVCNNDILLHPRTYELLLRDLSPSAPFVTGVGVRERDDFMRFDPDFREAHRADDQTAGQTTDQTFSPHPDFSCFLISRSVWRSVGPFDERFAGAYGEDCDYHCRMHKAGVRAVSNGVPFLHIDGGSGTIKALDEWDRRQVQKLADSNRIYFQTKWGFAIGTPEYEEFFQHD